VRPGVFHFKELYWYNWVGEFMQKWEKDAFHKEHHSRNLGLLAEEI